jgi:hypothetical protein
MNADWKSNRLSEIDRHIAETKKRIARLQSAIKRGQSSVSGRFLA